MSEPDLVGLFVAPLQRLGLDYMVTGGVAAVAYGDPRFTRDVDIVLALARGEVDSFAEAFSEPDFYLYRPVRAAFRWAVRSVMDAGVRG